MCLLVITYLSSSLIYILLTLTIGLKKINRLNIISDMQMI
nr:MAG TPA: hypothetical protein [Caudoviricetes sp.]